MGIIRINNISYVGSSITMNGNKIIIDGKDVSTDSKEIIIHIEGDINDLSVDNCDAIDVKGNVGNLVTKNGNVDVTGNVTGNVESKNGNINCGNVSGSVETKNGIEWKIGFVEKKIKKFKVLLNGTKKDTFKYQNGVRIK